MNTVDAIAMEEEHKDCRKMVFDWNKAALLIRERQPTEASAGLRGDWEWTGGNIYGNGSPIVDSDTYLTSTWAIPELDLDGEILECWCWQDETQWNARSKWPESALQILNGEET